MTAENLPVVIQAVSFAAEKHRKQRRLDVDSSPYINHPIALVHLLCVEARILEPEVLAAAALHDTIEDTSTTLIELHRKFGPRIADIVSEVTDDKSLPPAMRKSLQIKTAPKKSREATLVTIADKIANLRDIKSNPPPAWSAERCQDYFDWARQVVERLPIVSQELIELFEEAYRRRI